MAISIEQQAENILAKLVTDPGLKQFVDSDLHIPKPFRPDGEVKLIFLGQDPTVKNPKSRKWISTVLNLNKAGSLRNYLGEICKGLGIELEKNVYATNYIKNFFIKPPTQIKEVDIFTKFAPIWLPFLQEEIVQFGNIPIITLGQPVLSLIIQGDTPKLVREYWGYNNEWKTGKTLPFKRIENNNNVLNRVIYPFPHQPSISKQFYFSRLKEYIAFMQLSIAQ
jgi:hypothetical protein